ncbi:MAG: DUF998 domain-containing protein [Candidatus Lokiarchaeota archaeon]|nr:DUF998 domain-containing protein [Candidatus Lokiarchaeota archaeon]
MSQKGSNASKKRFKDIMTGNFSKKFLTRVWIPIMLAIFIGFLAIAWLLFPGYDWTEMAISLLGNPQEHPNGWYFWAIGMAVTGFLMFPIPFYVYKTLQVDNENVKKIGCFLLLLSSFGMMGMGAIPNFDQINWLHEINAGFAMGGLYLGLFILEFSIIKDKRIKKIWVVLFLGCLWFGPVGFCITQFPGYFATGEFKDIGPWFLHFSTWEWALMVCVFVAFLLSAFIMPEKNVEDELEIKNNMKKVNNK